MSITTKTVTRVAIREAEVVFAQEMADELRTLGKTLQGSVREKMRFDLGAERKNVRRKVTGSMFRKTLTVSGDLPQTLVDEFGRRAGAKMPPWSDGTPLFGWVGRKLSPPANRQRSVSFLVARKIAREGIAPGQPFAKTAEESAQLILDSLDAAINRGLQRLNG